MTKSSDDGLGLMLAASARGSNEDDGEGEYGDWRLDGCDSDKREGEGGMENDDSGDLNVSSVGSNCRWSVARGSGGDAYEERGSGEGTDAGDSNDPW